MKVVDIEEMTERVRGYASSVNSRDFRRSGYAEGVAKLLYDGQRKFGDDWIQSTASKLYAHKKNNDGDLTGSNVPSGVGIATFTDIPLIGGEELLRLYRGAGNRNPLGDIDITFAVQFNGEPERNPVQARYLLEKLSQKRIDAKEGVIDLGKLRLDVNDDGSLVYKLSADFREDDVKPISEYPFVSVGKNGLFGAYFNNDGDFWYADSCGLESSLDISQVVRYDLKKSHNEPDLVKRVTDEFLARF